MTEDTSSDDTMSVASELQDHIDAVEQWSSDVSALNVGDATKGVISRFVRDCKLLVEDCKASENPSTEDLCDLKDYRDMLNIRHHNLVEDNSQDVSKGDD
jgi:hypothetical protein